MSAFRSLHTKVMISFLVLTLIPLLATGLYGHFFTRRALSQQILERSEHQVHLQADAIVSSLQQVQGDALYLATLRNVDALRQETSADEAQAIVAEIEQDFLVMAAVRPMYRGIQLIDSTGEEIAGVEQVGELQVGVTAAEDRENYAAAPYFNAVMEMPIDAVYLSPYRAEGIAYIHYAVHIPGGVLLIDLSAGWLLRALPIQPVSDTWAVLDQDGRLIVYPDGFRPELVTEHIPTMLGGGSGSFETSDSVLVFDSIYPSTLDTEGSGAPQFWVIFRQTPSAVLYSAVNDFYRLAVVFMVGAAFLAVALALMTSRLLVNPIRQLELMAARFGHDGVAPQLPAQITDDEVGRLTSTFYNMAYELDTKRKEERRLIERLINAQEEERKLVAFDLHDGLLQQLVGARFYLGNIQEQFANRLPESGPSIQRGCDALTEAIVEGRRIIEGLRPAALDDLGLAAAIEDIARSTADVAGWTLALDIHPLPVEPEKTVGVTLYRIAQEALNNTRKHATAHNVSVALHNGHGIHLTIIDDGSGFDLLALKPGETLDGESRGLGITTMRERASLIDGQCVIKTALGKGTQVDVVVPNCAPADRKAGS